MIKRLRQMGFTIICLAVLLAGAALRVHAGWPAPLGAAAPATGQAPDGLKETVLNFYHLVDKGQYAQAYDLALENQWQSSGGTPVAKGLTGKDEFVAELSDELGANGMGLNIVSIDMVSATPLPAAEQSPVKYSALWTLKHLSTGMVVDGVYRAAVSGTLLGRCSRWDWHRVVLAAHIKGQGWRVLLPGKPTPTSPHYEEWFLDRQE